MTLAMSAPARARLIAASALAGTLVAAAIAPVAAQDYPTRPIEMIVTWGPGGGADQTGRMIGKLLEPMLKVSLPVENVAGSAGVTGLNKLLNGNSRRLSARPHHGGHAIPSGRAARATLDPR